MVIPLVILMAALGNPGSFFPVEPPGAEVIDRAMARVALPGEEYTLYLMLYNLDGAGTIEIQSGVRLQDSWHWEQLFLWRPVDIEGDPVMFSPRSVLMVDTVESGFTVTWVDSPDIPEGSASILLEYDLRRGTPTEHPIR